jgi:hypothetical protein
MPGESVLRIPEAFYRLALPVPDGDGNAMLQFRMLS